MRIAPVLILVFLFSFLSMAAHAGKIYKWRDADGNIHYGSAPPPEAEAKSTGQKTTTKKPEPPADAEGEDKDNESSKSDKDRIRELEERLEKLEGKRHATKKSDNGKTGEGEPGEPDAVAGEDSEETLSEEDKKPDYSVDGQVRMLEQAERIQRMKTRCRAKAPHGVNCNNPESYKQY